MNKGQIEQAAKEAINEYYGCYTSHYCYKERCCYCDGNEPAHDCDFDCSADAFNEGFVTGAEWQRKAVWHDADEKYNDLRDILWCLETTNGIFYTTTLFETGCEYKIIKWAYVGDLLPERKEG